MVDQDGLLVEGMNTITWFQKPFVQDRAKVASWPLEQPEKVTLLDVVRNAKPTTLIGVSGQPGAFSEPIVRAMAEINPRPVIFPLSNPTSRAEAAPEDILRWSQGRAVIGTGSPFPPVTRGDGRLFKVDQTNNSYIFPGVGLGVIAVRARRLTDTMFMAAAKALAAMSPARNDPNANLLPPVTELREVSIAVALATALQARKEGLTEMAEAEVEPAIHAKMWSPKYLPYRRATMR
jgi:malate dehydrogenase (oxaloacetate-decarboxylating)